MQKTNRFRKSELEAEIQAHPVTQYEILKQAFAEEAQDV
jgi:hypothetical protein